MATVAALNNAVVTTKHLRDTDLKLNEAENQNKIADLYNALSDLKINFADIKQELLNKAERIKELEEAQRIKDDLAWEDPFYYLTKSNKKDGPYCQTCYDTKKLLVRIPRNDQDTHLKCNSCNKFYDKTNGNFVRSNHLYEGDHDPYSGF